MPSRPGSAQLAQMITAFFFFVKIPIKVCVTPGADQRKKPEWLIDSQRTRVIDDKEQDKKADRQIKVG